MRTFPDLSHRMFPHLGTFQRQRPYRRHRSRSGWSTRLGRWRVFGSWAGGHSAPVAVRNGEYK